MIVRVLSLAVLIGCTGCLRIQNSEGAAPAIVDAPFNGSLEHGRDCAFLSLPASLDYDRGPSPLAFNVTLWSVCGEAIPLEGDHCWSGLKTIEVWIVDGPHRWYVDHGAAYPGGNLASCMGSGAENVLLPPFSRLQDHVSWNGTVMHPQSGGGDHEPMRLPRGEYLVTAAARHASGPMGTFLWNAKSRLTVGPD